MSSIDTQTLIDANHKLSASIHALDAYIAGTIRNVGADIQQLADLTAHALLFASLVANHSGGITLDELAQKKLSELPDMIASLRGVAER